MPFLLSDIAGEQARLEDLYSYRVLDSSSESEFDDLALLASEVCETPISLITLVDSDRQWFKARVGVDVCQTDRESSFCAHSIATGQMLVIPDATEDPRFSDNRLVTGPPHIKFYAGCPMVSRKGMVLGSLCVIDTKPRELSAHQSRILRMLAQQAMDRLEARRDAMLNDRMLRVASKSGSAIVIIDRFGRIEWTNSAYEGLVGCVAHEEADTTSEIRFGASQQDTGFMNQALQRCGPGEIVERELEGTCPDGRQLWLSLSTGTFQNKEGHPDGVFQVLTDTSFQRQREFFERDQGRVLQSIASGAPLKRTLHLIIAMLEAQDPSFFCSAVLVDPENGRSSTVGVPLSEEEIDLACREGVFAEAPAAVPQCATIRQALNGQGFRAFWGTPLHSHSGKMAGAFVARFRRATPVKAEQLRLLELGASLVESAIEKKRSEEEEAKHREFLHRMLESSRDSISVLGLDGRLLWINGADSEISTAYGSEETRRTSWIEAWEGEDRAAAVRAIEAAKLGDVGHFRGFCAGPDGESGWWDVHITPIRDADGRPDRLLVVSRDVTQSALAEKNLIESKESAEQASRMKTEFLANVSHEMRTPLNGVLGMAQLLELSDLDSKQRTMLATVQASASMLLHLISDLLDLSSIEAGKLRIESRPFSPLSRLDKIVATRREACTAKGLELLTQFDPALSSERNGDPARFGQIVGNLIDNAVKFTDSGTVTVVASPTTDMSGIVVLVKDTGIGVDPSEHATVFDKFRQLDGAAARRNGGMGLGLSIVRDFAERMGGTVSLKSDGSTGSEFALTLPFPLVAPDVAPVPAARTKMEGIRVLVVEDNPVNGAVALGLLRKLGCQTEWVISGEDALQKLSDSKFEVVFMDIQMPDMDGYETTRLVRQREALSGFHVPIIALTAHAMQADRELCLAAGMDDHLAKPYKLDDLYKAIEPWIGIKEDGFS
ncbi:MAG: response regulator [Alphaproteobacteria bacterium]|nr:MAG: response regulator [Alphaproteobacteria bacterium]